MVPGVFSWHNIASFSTTDKWEDELEKWADSSSERRHKHKHTLRMRRPDDKKPVEKSVVHASFHRTATFRSASVVLCTFRRMLLAQDSIQTHHGGEWEDELEKWAVTHARARARATAIPPLLHLPFTPPPLPPPRFPNASDKASSSCTSLTGLPTPPGFMVASTRNAGCARMTSVVSPPRSASVSERPGSRTLRWRRWWWEERGEAQGTGGREGTMARHRGAAQRRAARGEAREGTL